MADGRRVLAVLPHEHFARMYLTGPVADALAADPAVRWWFATRTPADADHVRSLGAAGGGWAELVRPFRGARPAGMGARLRWSLHQVAAAAGFYVHLSLVYRFNSRHGFRGFRNRLRLSRPARVLARREGHPVDRWLGWPLPRSRRVERAVGRLYHARWQRQPEVEALFDDVRPDLLVLATVQSPFVTPYVLAARARGIAVLGAIGSWDQPTTKGPMVPGVDRYVAPSRWTAEQARAIHGIEAVDVIGWLQMDAHFDDRAARTRPELLEELGAGADARLIVFGAYTQRLGAHEPAILAGLKAQVQAGAFGDACTLVIRPHPADTAWRERLGHLDAPPHVVVESNGQGGAEHLANLMRHADVVMTSAGTLCLDAVANDTPAIGIAFTADASTPFYDRPERMFEMEHYASVVETGAVPLARDAGELVALVREALADPGRRARERAALRDLHLEPLDGLAARRLVGLVREMVDAS